VTITYYKAGAAILIFLISMISVIYPLKRKNALQHADSIGLGLGDALASGIFLGAAFFHMLPDSLKLFHSVYPLLSYPVPEAICVGGFLLMLLLERLSPAHSNQSIPYILVIILTIHALTEGAALGIGSNFTDILMLLIAISAHKGSESFALCMALIKYDLSFRKLFVIILLFSLMTPLGIALGTSVNQLTFDNTGKLAEAILSAFAAGTFLYMSTLHHVHAHKHENDKQGMLEFACLVFGLTTMGVIAFWT
jgi:zinc transporter 1/2/3